MNGIPRVQRLALPLPNGMSIQEVCILSQTLLAHSFIQIIYNLYLFRLKTDRLLQTPRSLGNPRGRVRIFVRFVWYLIPEIRSSITISPVSVAALGLVSSSRGLSLRFPRFIRIREDKSIEQASSPEFVASLWKKQDGNMTIQGGVDDGDLVDVDADSDHPYSDE